MINNIIILALCLPLLTLAQKEALTYNQLQDIKFAEQYENNTSIDSYTTKGGLIICIGDTLTIGNAVIKGGDYMLDDVFSHIVVGKTKGTYNKDFKSLPHKYSGSKVIVKSLFVTHEKFTGYKLWPNRNKMPLYVSVFGRSPKKGFLKILGFSRKTILDIEKALLSGEIINHNTPLLKDKEGDELVDKKSNGKYDQLLQLGELKALGILTDEEFEKEKKRILNDY